MIIKYKELLIRKVRLDDADILYSWWTDGNVMAHAGFPNGLDITLDKIKEDIIRYSDETLQVLILEINNKPVGETNYRNKGNNVAEIGIKICNPDFQNRGYGTDFLKMLIDALFNKLNYDKILIDVNAKNLRAKHIYEKIGFKQINFEKDFWIDQQGVAQSFFFYEMFLQDFQLLK